MDLIKTETVDQNNDESNSTSYYLEKYEPICLEAIKSNIDSFDQSNLNERLDSMKKIEHEIRKNCDLNTNDLDILAAQNLDNLKLYETELSKQSEKILTSEFCTERNNFHPDKLSHLFETRLVLKNRLNKTNSKFYKKLEQESNVKAKLDSMNRDLAILTEKYEEAKQSEVEVCDSLASELSDCYVVYNK
jgi:hypothetical protein